MAHTIVLNYLFELLPGTPMRTLGMEQEMLKALAEMEEWETMEIVNMAMESQKEGA